MELTIKNNVSPKPVLFEYPLQENIRNYLRLESLFKQYKENIFLNHTNNHLHALKILFEILEILERGDTRSELIKELSRLCECFQLLKKNPKVDNTKLDTFLNQIETLKQWAHTYQGKFGESVRNTAFISSVKLKTNIPGGSSFFDCPELYLFLNKSTKERKEHFDFWLSHIKGVATSIEVILILIRDSSDWQITTANKGNFILETPSQSFKLLRVKLVSNEGLFPEFSCGRHRSNIHFMKFNPQYKKIICKNDVSFELACCQ